jgi:SulP family sulfate permease
VLPTSRRHIHGLTLKGVFAPDQPLPREQDPPSELSAGQATVLTLYGSTLYATARLMEGQLPVVTETTARAVVILNLRQHEQLGSTLLGMLERYAESLREHDSKLVLAEVGPHLYEQQARTGRLQTLKPRNVFRYTDTVGASVIEALDAAQEWIEARGAEGTAAARSSAAPLR